VVDLTMRIANLPHNSSACAANTETSYERISIHNRLILIPRQTQLDILSASGTESTSKTEFTNCREYASTIRFLPDGPTNSTGQGTTIPAHDETTTLPAGLPFDARIITSVDSDTAAAGDPIEAVLLSPIRNDHKAVLAPAGARIHGRLTNVRWRSKPLMKYELTVRFEFVEINGRKVAFSAVLEPPHSQVLTGTFSGSRLIPLKPDGDPSTGSTFSFSQDHMHVKNLDARWVTVDPRAAKESN